MLSLLLPLLMLQGSLGSTVLLSKEEYKTPYGVCGQYQGLTALVYNHEEHEEIVKRLFLKASAKSAWIGPEDFVVWYGSYLYLEKIEDAESSSVTLKKNYYIPTIERTPPKRMLCKVGDPQLPIPDNFISL